MNVHIVVSMHVVVAMLLLLLQLRGRAHLNVVFS